MTSVTRLLIDSLDHETGEHIYWSTHCRHGRHEACSATEMVGLDVIGDGARPRVPRKPAQCKTCAAPCVCDCHRGS